MLPKILFPKATVKSPFRCPTCKTSLNTAELGNTLLDVCNTCDGIWFEKKDFKTSMGAYQFFVDTEQAIIQGTVSQEHCPTGDKFQLKVFQPLPNEPELAAKVCPSCSGVWLNKKVLPYLQTQSTQTYANKPSAPHTEANYRNNDEQPRVPSDSFSNSPNRRRRENSEAQLTLYTQQNLYIKQIRENWEWFGVETRNKYTILGDRGDQVGYAAEKATGMLGALVRQFFGHWRKFDICFFDSDRNLLMTAHHPFRFFFQRMELSDNRGITIGALEQRFSILRKCFDITDSSGRVILKTSSPIWKPWTFQFDSRNAAVAVVKKKWSGILSEAFTD